MARGRLRIYLGAAPGVGKTFAMLDEGWRRRSRGTDVVVGYVETHGRARTAAQLRDLEVVPRRRLEHRGASFEEMDVDAVLARRPAVALVDELAHTNVPGSRNAKRWLDVEELLDAGIDVISTVNVQHLESVNDVVEEITGVKQQETLPDEVVRAADQLELVDMSPEALRRRMAHGNIYAADKIDAALGNYFRPGNLAALRELALLWTADRVDEGLQDYRLAHGIDRPWETRERVVVAVTGAPSGAHLIRRAARIASRARGELIGVHVRPDDGLVEAPSDLLVAHRTLLADLGGELHEVVGSDPAEALVAFSVAENATQLVLGASRRTRAAELVRGSVINDVIRRAGPIDVHVISNPSDEVAGAGLSARRRPPAVPRRRQLWAWALVVLGTPLLTLALHLFQGSLDLAGQISLYLLFVTVVAVVGGVGPAIAAAILTSLALNWFFTEPRHTLTIAETSSAIALGVFLVVGVTVSLLVSQVARRSGEAARARAEAEAIARTAGTLVDSPDPLPALLEHVRTTFALDAVVLRRMDGERVVEEAAAGPPIPPESPGTEHIDLAGGARLVVVGRTLRADDRRVLQALAAQLDVADQHRRLRREAADAQAAAQGDRLRTALLRAVSHDLRTPLASIKASVTSLQQHDVAWSDEDREEFLATIDEETDRLDRLVGNLLDMGRLESGAVRPLLSPVGLEEVVPSALASLGGDLARHGPDRVRVDVAESLPRVLADADLLERVVANLVANALRFGGGGGPVRIDAGRVGGRVDLRVVDTGPGVPSDLRDGMFEPFQRLGDGGHDSGVGLGLAVARGFIDAMDGQLAAEDTPGGGLTVVVSLPVAA
jgi:two-component system sensor histidine kinase KdpD